MAINRLWRVAAALMVMAAAGALTVPSATAQTFDRALATAYTNNPTLQAERAALRSTDEQVSQALSNWRPTLTFDGEIGKSAVNSESAFFTSRDNRSPKTAALNLNQPIYRGGRTVAGVRRAENQVQAARARLTSTEQQVLLDGVRAYMDVVRDQAVLRLNINNEEVLRRQLEATRDRFRVGEVTLTDVSQAEARLAGATADRLQAEGDLEASRATYERVIGEPPGELTRPAPLDFLPATREDAMRAAGQRNPDVTAADFNERAARDNVRVVSGELLPTLSLNGELSRREALSSEDSLNETASFTAQLRVPLYQAGSVSSRVREAKQVANQRRIEVEEARRAAVEAARQAWERLQAVQARIVSLRAQIEASEIALEGVQQEALVGARTVLDVLDAEQELLNSRVNLVRSQRDETVAEFELAAAVGLLTARQLGLPVEIYDVKGHYREVRGKLWGLGQ